MPPSLSINVVLGLLLLTGLLLGLAASKLGFPRVPAYVIAGVLFSDSLLGGITGVRVGAWSEPLTTAALSLIAFVIGGSITAGQLRRTGRTIIGCLMGEAFGAVIVVALSVLLILPGPLRGVPAATIAIAFGAVAAATDPAAAIAVIHQYRARGPLSKTLLGVVALDDALGIVLFAMVVVLTTGASVATGLGVAVWDILASVGLGAAGGYVLSLLGRHVRQRALHLPMALAGVLLTAGLAETWDWSPLLAAMALGFSARTWAGATGHRLLNAVEHLEELMFLVFFTVAGSHFHPSVFRSQLALILVYFLARIAGKVVGAMTAARLVGAPPPVKRWLGIGLMPQAGVAVGLALTLGHRAAFAPVATMMVNVILGTTLLYELIGPLAVRLALVRAGELGVKREGAHA